MPNNLPSTHVSSSAYRKVRCIFGLHVPDLDQVESKFGTQSTRCVVCNEQIHRQAPRNRKSKKWRRTKGKSSQVRPAIRSPLCLLNRHRPTRYRVKWDGFDYVSKCRSCGQPIRRVNGRRWIRDWLWSTQKSESVRRE